MRIASAQIYDSLLAGIRKQMDVQAAGNEQIASGNRFLRPAQAGFDYKTSLDLRHARTAAQAGLDALAVAESRLGYSQSVLADINKLMLRAQTLATQQASGQIGATERQAAAAEAAALREQIFALANQNWQGQSLFGGTAVDRPAFVKDAAGNAVYNGSAADRIVAVDDNLQVVSNVRGDHPAFAAMFSALQSFESALRANNTPALQAAKDALTNAGNAMIDLTTEVGARLDAVRLYKSGWQDLKLNIEKQLNDHEGVDIPAVVSRLQQSGIALQAAYAQVAKLRQLSLVNFLR